jgi:hypothetical protein
MMHHFGVSHEICEAVKNNCTRRLAGTSHEVGNFMPFNRHPESGIQH